ncbi:MAG: tyrosine--tRNA ligase [Patescibacteria group bacterium]
MKIITDESKIQELLTRGVEEVIEFEHLKKRLLAGEQLRVKLGIDPTSPNIHIGRAVILWKLREFQDLGHKAVFIVGDFTGQIGDTSDKESERSGLSEEEVKRNMKTYFDQAFKILDKNRTEAHYNSKWLSAIGYRDIDEMLELFSLHEFEARENIAKRLTAGKRVSLRELLYPLMQGYDSAAIKADVELGGTDQKYNLLAGRVIQKHYGQSPQDIMTMKFPLLGPDGRKMSSSWGNVINITDEPNNMFGKVMSIGDDLIVHYFEMATQVPANEIREFEQSIRRGDNPRDIKLRLAWEIVRMYHGDREATKARDEWERVFSKGELPSEMEEVEGGKLVDVVGLGAGVSLTQAKRLIDEGAVKVNGEVIKEWEKLVSKSDVIQIGPKKFVKIKN